MPGCPAPRRDQAEPAMAGSRKSRRGEPAVTNHLRLSQKALLRLIYGKQAICCRASHNNLGITGVEREPLSSRL